MQTNEIGIAGLLRYRPGSYLTTTIKITRQLLTERTGKTGLVRIQLTFCWDSQRLRRGSGQKCLPKEWDGKRELLKAKTGSASQYVDTVNAVLQAYADAAHHDAQLTGQRLTVSQMKAKILRRYQEAAATQDELPPIPAPLPPPPPTFADHYSQWPGEQARRTNLRTGQRLSQVYLTSLADSLTMLSLAGMSTASSLPPDEPVGAAALTQAELLAIAEVDFYTHEARELVRAHFASLDASQKGQPRRRGQRRHQVDDYRILERLRQVSGVRLPGPAHLRRQPPRAPLPRLRAPGGASKSRQDAKALRHSLPRRRRVPPGGSHREIPHPAVAHLLTGAARWPVPAVEQLREQGLRRGQHGDDADVLRG